MRKGWIQKDLEEREERRRKKDAQKFLYEQEGRKRQNMPVQNSVRNREFAVVAYLFLAVFLGMIAYFTYFQAEKSEAFINSPYNARQDAFADRILRGDIKTAQGEVIATTKTAADGSESRSYPYGRLFAHAVGFATNGKAGIESISNFQLLRSHAFFLEKILKELQDKKNIGDTVVTTLDLRVQKAAYDALGSYQGAVIAMQPSTGKILAMVSKPDFDPNTIAKDWEDITTADSNSSVLLNRVTQGLYPPGSTFKIFTLLEYMKENRDYKNYAYQCGGSISRDGNAVHCFGNAVHGQEDLKTAFAHSCNTSFSDIGLSLNLDKFARTNKSLLFQSELPCEFPYKQSSFSLESGASDWEVMQTSIGQGKTLVTPYHMALIMSAINNDGILMKPYIIDRVENYDGAEVAASQPEAYQELFTHKKASTLRQYLRAVVTEGTGTALNVPGYTAAGKTGSAEFTSKKDSHAWFVGYASKEGEQDLVVSIVLEGAGTGGAYAVPVAKAVFDAYFGS
ncbi:MAG: penicillin-binding protein 2 [Eubacterium sp.]|nr:penicillin-binding protein 2 [Eubacterium sp.]